MQCSNPLFAFAALLPWNYFVGALTRSGTSLVNNANLITKIYFPRLVIPLAGVINGLVDFGISLIVLIGLMFYYSVVPGIASVTLPLFLLMAIGTALGVSLWLSALLALALYERGALALGKARVLAGMTRWEFEELLGQRRIVRHYTAADLVEDICYGHDD